MVDSAIVGLSCLFAVSFIWNIAMVYLMCRLDPELPNGLSRTLYAIVCGDASNRPSDKYAMRKTIDDEGDGGAAGRGQGQESKEAPPRQQSVRKHKRKATLLTVDDVLSTNQQWEIDPNKLRMKSIIGKGNFGEVWLALWLGSPVAVKTILARLQDKEKLVDRFIQEIIMMRSLHHFLKNEDKHHIRITMSHVLRFALDIARGVYYLHRKQSIVQRDLKARNILVDESLNAKVADFGLSRVIDEEEANKLTACGTPAWTAPEVVRMEQYTEKVDVYSFGIIMWELITRQEPYGGRKGVQIAYAAAEQGLRPDIPSYCPQDYADLMQECWQDQPDDRPTFSNILKRLFQLKKRADAVAQNALPVLKRAYQQAEAAAAAENGTVVNINATVGRPAGPRASAATGSATGSAGAAVSSATGGAAAGGSAGGGEDLELPRPPPGSVGSATGTAAGHSGGSASGSATGGAGQVGLSDKGQSGKSFEVLPTAQEGRGIGDRNGNGDGDAGGSETDGGIALGGSLLSFGGPLGSTTASVVAGGGGQQQSGQPEGSSGADDVSPVITPAASRAESMLVPGTGSSDAIQGRRPGLTRENTSRGDRELREHFGPLPRGIDRTKSTNTMSRSVSSRGDSVSKHGGSGGKDALAAGSSEAGRDEGEDEEKEREREERRKKRREAKRNEALEAVQSALAQGVVQVQAPDAEVGWDGSVSSDDEDEDEGKGQGGEEERRVGRAGAGSGSAQAWDEETGGAGVGGGAAGAARGAATSASESGGGHRGRDGSVAVPVGSQHGAGGQQGARQSQVQGDFLPGTVPMG